MVHQALGEYYRDALVQPWMQQRATCCAVDEIGQFPACSDDSLSTCLKSEIAVGRISIANTSFISEQTWLVQQSRLTMIRSIPDSGICGITSNILFVGQ